MDATAKAAKAVFTLAMLSLMSLTMLCLIYLPWPIEVILSVSRRPRWPRQVKSSQVMSPVAVTGSFANKCRQCKRSLTVVTVVALALVPFPVVQQIR